VRARIGLVVEAFVHVIEGDFCNIISRVDRDQIDTIEVLALPIFNAVQRFQVGTVSA
jgi:hypothetical protein